MQIHRLNKVAKLMMFNNSAGQKISNILVASFADLMEHVTSAEESGIRVKLDLI